SRSAFGGIGRLRSLAHGRTARLLRRPRSSSARWARLEGRVPPSAESAAFARSLMVAPLPRFRGLAPARLAGLAPRVAFRLRRNRPPSLARSSPRRPGAIDRLVDHLLVLARVGPEETPGLGERVDRVEIGEVAAGLHARRGEDRDPRRAVVVIVAVD